MLNINEFVSDAVLLGIGFVLFIPAMIISLRAKKVQRQIKNIQKTAILAKFPELGEEGYKLRHQRLLNYYQTATYENYKAGQRNALPAIFAVMVLGGAVALIFMVQLGWGIILLGLFLILLGFFIKGQSQISLRLRDFWQQYLLDHPENPLQVQALGDQLMYDQARALTNQARALLLGGISYLFFGLIFL